MNWYNSDKDLNVLIRSQHTGTNTKLDFHLQGAPNFRAAELNVYGVAQPTVFSE